MEQFHKAWYWGENHNLIDWAEGKRIPHQSLLHLEGHQRFQQLRDQVGVDMPFIITREY
jgi:hypothetical protein